MVGDTHFQRYLPDPHPESLVPPEEIRRHILCSGMPFFLVALTGSALMRHCFRSSLPDARYRT